MGAAMSAEKIWRLVSEGIFDTLYMTIPATILAYLVGLPLGVLLVITKRGHIMPAPTFNAVLGSIIPFDVTGIDFSLTALFLTVFIEQWLSTKDHASALIGVIASLLCVVVFGLANFLLPAMAAILISLTVLRAVRKEAAHA